MKTNKSFKKQPLIYWCTYLSAIEEHFKILIELATWLCKICTIHKIKYCHSPIYTRRGKNEGPFNCREINSLHKIFLVCTLKDGDLFTEWIFIEDWRTVSKDTFFLKKRSRNSVNATRKLQFGARTDIVVEAKSGCTFLTTYRDDFFMTNTCYSCSSGGFSFSFFKNERHMTEFVFITAGTIFLAGKSSWDSFFSLVII